MNSPPHSVRASSASTTRVYWSLSYVTYTIARLRCGLGCLCVCVWCVCARARTCISQQQAELPELSDRKKRNKIFTLIGQYSKYNWHHLARELLSENLSSKSMEAIKHFVHTRGA